MKIEQLQEYLDYAGSTTVPDVHLDTSGLHALDQLFETLGIAEKGSCDLYCRVGTDQTYSAFGFWEDDKSNSSSTQLQTISDYGLLAIS